MDAVEDFQFLDLGEGGIAVVGGDVALYGQQHLVLAGVLGGDELEDLCFVSVGLQQEGAEAVGDHFGFLAQMDAVAERGLEWGGNADLRTNLFVTAGSADDERGTCADAFVDGLVRGRVAGMEGYHDVESFR